MNFYNDNEPAVYAWLRRLVAAGHLPAGDVNPAPVQLLTPASLAGYTSAHFFAGVGGWPLALRMAGWPDDQPVWTASLPCQPFSNAGKRLGDKDERHLWPVFRSLVAECRPPTIFGEQVASRAGREWLAGVRADLEALGYAVGAADLCAAGVGAPHIRQRLFWVADAEHTERRKVNVDREDGRNRPNGGRTEAYGEPRARSEIRGLAYAERGLAEQPTGPGARPLGSHGGRAPSKFAGRGAVGRVADAMQPGRAEGWTGTRSGPIAGGSLPRGLGDPNDPGLAGRQSLAGDDGPQRTPSERAGSDAGWSDSRWHLCLDGKYRRVPLEPELFPLAHGVPGRVGQLRAYGNAIVPQVAATFVKAFMDVRL